MKRTPSQVVLEMQNLLSRNPVFLDTETTGLTQNDRIVEIAIIAAGGQVLLDTLINPGIAIVPQAEAVHHISGLMVADAPMISELAPEIEHILNGRPVVIYNANFDVGFLHNAGIWPVETFCLMQAAQDYFGLSRWPRLDVACYRLQIQRPASHRAKQDAEDARRVFLAIAAGGGLYDAH